MPTQNAIRVMRPYPMWTVHFGNRRGNRCVREIALKSLFFGTDRLLPSGEGGGGYFENAQNVRGVEILRHRADLLCKSYQTVLALFK